MGKTRDYSMALFFLNWICLSSSYCVAASLSLILSSRYTSILHGGFKLSFLFYQKRKPSDQRG